MYRGWKVQLHFLLLLAWTYLGRNKISLLNFGNLFEMGRQILTGSDENMMGLEKKDDRRYRRNKNKMINPAFGDILERSIASSQHSSFPSGGRKVEAEDTDAVLIFLT